ncbi:unnamed protein product, partial [Vitis vinifera]
MSSMPVSRKLIWVATSGCQLWAMRMVAEGVASPEFQVFLNDLPGNDFNNIFSLLPDFYEKLTKEEDGTLGNCFITGVPGSFYSRIFPSRSLDFVHSSCSVHWLSQAPAGLEKNKGHVHIANGSPPTVIEAYTNQFQRDFSLFFRLTL